MKTVSLVRKDASTFMPDRRQDLRTGRDLLLPIIGRNENDLEASRGHCAKISEPGLVLSAPMSSMSDHHLRTIGRTTICALRIENDMYSYDIFTSAGTSLTDAWTELRSAANAPPKRSNSVIHLSGWTRRRRPVLDTMERDQLIKDDGCVYAASVKRWAA